MLSEQSAKRSLGKLELQREFYENDVAFLSNEVKNSETIAISGSIKAGAICDEPGALGSAELVSRLLMRGTKSLSAGQIAQRIEEAGATLSFDNRDESVSFSSRCYYGVLDDVLEILGECLMHPSFPEQEVVLAKNEILSEIRAEEDDTRSMASRRLAELVFGKNAPYGRETLGKIDDLKVLTSRDLANFHSKNYFPNRLILAMTGGYQFEAVRAKIGKIFSGWGNSGPGRFFFKIDGEVVSQNAVVEMKHKTQVDLAIGTRAVARSSHDYYPFNLGNLILGRLGLYGRLGENIRERRGLAYYSFSALQAKLFSGWFGVFAGVNPANVSKAFDGIFEEITKITAEPIPQKELETAKRNSLGSLSISLDTSVERVAILHEIEYNGLGMDYLDRYPAILDRVSSEEILTCFQKYVRPDRLSMVAAGPVKDKDLPAIPRTAD